MTDYKDTLNLPQTSFPMKAELTKKEPGILADWYKADVYHKMREARKNSRKFVLHDGPPYANGKAHIGHAFNRVLKDIVIKAKFLTGFDVPFVPGWDCHGLPIELKAEKKVGKAGEKISAREFRLECQKYAKEQVELQKGDLQKLGVFGDWERPYLTMDHKYEANVVRALATVVKNGYIEKGFKPIHWCLDCQSSLAEAEVEYYDKKSPSCYVKFFIHDQVHFINKFSLPHIETNSIYIAVWTTTPWTLPANQAVCVHPDLEYAITEIGEFENREMVIVAKSLLLDLFSKWNIEKYNIVKVVTGKELEHIILRHPFEERTIPCILGEHVTFDTGTGAVHTAPAHGVEDFAVAAKYNLKIETPVDARGLFINNHFLAGLHIFKVETTILDLLKTNKTLIFHETLEHSYPHCWRHKTPVVYRTTAQWFVNLNNNNLREKALNSINQVEWIPQWARDRIYSMVENRPDWCISRQNRAWGMPMCFIVHKETKELHPKILDIMHIVANNLEKHGIEYWYDCDICDLISKDEANHYEKSIDTLDVWFDAGVSHFCVLKDNADLNYPADLYLEGSDQHRGWFQAALLTGIAVNGNAPYRSVLTHGYAVDEYGKKMSKSLGNVVSPEDIRTAMGADILRLWVAATDYRSDVSISNEILKRISEAYRRIRNTARFFLANLFDFDPLKNMVPYDQMLALDQFIIFKTEELQQEIIRYYDTYQFHLVFQKIHNFCTNEMGSFYLDIIKDRQYTCAKNSVARRSCQTAIFYALNSLVKWLAPILSFTAEEIWQYIPGNKEQTVFSSVWPQKYSKNYNDKELNAEFWNSIVLIKQEVNKLLENARNNHLIGSGLEANVTLYCDITLKNKLDKIAKELHFILITSKAVLKDITEKNENAVLTSIPGLYLEIESSTTLKCVRCWHRRSDVGVNRSYPDLCPRCVENVYANGEMREIA